MIRLLAWISTEQNSPYTMFAKDAVFQPFRSKACENCHPIWCSDSLISRRFFASHRSVFLDFQALARKITPRGVVYQNTLLPNGKKQIPESHESLSDSDGFRCQVNLLPWKSRLVSPPRFTGTCRNYWVP